MLIATDLEIAQRLGALPGVDPRIVVSGNFATPWELVRLVDATMERCRVFVMNAQEGWPRRDGFVTETPFVGPGTRRDPWLDYLPMRLSLVPKLFSSVRPPDAVLLHTSTPRNGKVSLGIEVNILPAAIEQVRRRGGLVVAQLNANMPYTRGDAEIDVELIDAAIEVDEPLASPSHRSPDDAASTVGGCPGGHPSPGWWNVANGNRSAARRRHVTHARSSPHGGLVGDAERRRGRSGRSGLTRPVAAHHGHVSGWQSAALLVG